jgi:hypothetical protein
MYEVPVQLGSEPQRPKQSASSTTSMGVLATDVESRPQETEYSTPA